MKILLFIATSILALAASANTGYGEAGCGLGSIVMGKDGNQILAATTNSTGVQTFGITTGTSNCTDGGMVKSASQVPMFIEVNKASLAKDAARGEGETVAGLAKLIGCDSAKLAPAMKANYNKIFVESEMNSQKINRSIKGMVDSNRSEACGA